MDTCRCVYALINAIKREKIQCYKLLISVLPVDNGGGQVRVAPSSAV